MDFLASPNAPEDAIPDSVLDGHLTGVAVSPNRLNPNRRSPSDWMPKIWGDNSFASDARANWAAAAVMARNRAADGEAGQPDVGSADAEEPNGELAELLPGIVRAIHVFWTEGQLDLTDEGSLSVRRNSTAVWIALFPGSVAVFNPVKLHACSS